MPLAALFSCPSIRATATLLESDGWRPTPGAPVVLREGDLADGRPTLFVLPGMGGNVYNYYALAEHLPAPQRVVGLPLPGADGLEPPLTSIEAVAERFAASIRAEQPRGPYVLAGYSLGGRVAFEVARRLAAEQGPKSIGVLAMLDTPAPGWPRPLPWIRRAAQHARRVARGELTAPLKPILKRLRRAKPAAVASAAASSRGVGDKAERDAIESLGLPPEILRGVRLPAHVGDPAVRARHYAMVETYWRAALAWRPAPIDLPITVLRAAEPCWTNCDVSDPRMGWSRLTRGPVRVAPVPGSHGTLFHEAHVVEVAATLERLVHPFKQKS
jgi:thioesterase domain-containing protein